MEFEQFSESPFIVQFSFKSLLENMEIECTKNADFANQYANLLQEAKCYPELYTEISMPFLYQNKFLIDRLLSNVFPVTLTKNEIKAISIPFHNFLYHPTERFQAILNDTKEGFKLSFSGVSIDRFYIASCCAILHFYYHQSVRPDIPLFYDIPNKDGVMNHYRLLNNSNFIEIKPTENSIILNNEEIQLLLDNYEDIILWKKFFPQKSWILNGFSIVNLYDATTEIAISNLKSKLIEQPKQSIFLKEEINGIFRSIYQIADLDVGYTNFNYVKNAFTEAPINKVIHSTILEGIENESIIEKIYEEYFSGILNEKKYHSISDISAYLEKNPHSEIARSLEKKGIKSVVFARVYENAKHSGILELTSMFKSLNSVNVNKLDVVLPYLEDTIERLHTGFENEIAAIIQKEYTSIHPSVYWKFHEEAAKHLSINHGQDLPFQAIGFEQLIPLYGQSDVKNSSKLRNNAILEDLKTQLEMTIKLLENLESDFDTQPLIPMIEEKLLDLDGGLRAGTEVEIQHFIFKQILPILDKLKLRNISNNQKITIFYNQLDPKTHIIYSNRSRFDASISILNNEISALLDARQEEQQKIFPFYYERFKTDGVEHNIYIGHSIAPWLSFNKIYVQNIRIWQLRVLIETEIKIHQLNPKLPHPLEITSLILAFPSPLGIKFRMDEKRFDVDGSYNARYEMIKKRIDKAHIKNTNNRIVDVGKICIVYASSKEEKDFLSYIQILQNEGQLLQEIEMLEVENLPGVNGLKAIRVSVNMAHKVFAYPFLDNLCN